MQAKFKPIYDKGRAIWLRSQMTFSELTGAAWHEITGGYFHRGMPHRAAFRAWSWKKNPTRLGTPSWLWSPVEIVGKFQILVKLNSMNTNTSVSIARILWLNEHKQHEERWWSTSKWGTGGLESRPTRDSSVGGGLPALKAFGDSTSIDYLVRSTMVLVGGVSGAVGWKAKALGWNQEL
jgi:hypothetical protein